MGERNLYLNPVSVEEAQQRYRSRLKDLLPDRTERIPTTDAFDRISACAVYAKYSSPFFNSSAMDGIAVISDRTIGATEKTPIRLKEHVDYIVVDTGDPIHAPFDAVIMAEDLLETKSKTEVCIIEPAAAWQHIRPVGEDIVAGEMILPGHHKIRAMDIGVLLSAGITNIEVIKQPIVSIFPTGSEIIEPGETLKEGSIIESNSRMFEHMVAEQGGIAKRCPILKDCFETIKNEVKKALEYSDMVLINAGSSAGRDDYTVQVLRELGEVVVHGVSIKPGKPVILAIVNNKPVIGLPGYPVSAYISFESFVAPLLAMMGKRSEKRNAHVRAVLSRRLVSNLKYREYVRVKIGMVGGKWIASPLARGAGAAMSLVRADGFCIIDRNQEGVEAGEEVEVSLFNELSEMKNTVVVTGSHDLILDVLSDMMSVRNEGFYISSTHVGSMGGLMALKRGEAHIAPIHLLDDESRQYNVPYIKRLFHKPMALIRGVGRTQGIMVKKGNPMGISGIGDLKKCRFVNRQRGAGTRILLDFLLEKNGILPEEIRGYDMESPTHMSLAALVAGEGVDAGMGIFSAAKAMGLDFIPVGEEQYDFAVPKEYLDLPHVQAFIKLLGSEEFAKKLEGFGGYSAAHAGEIYLTE